jgi:hypothetical protein
MKIPVDQLKPFAEMAVKLGQSKAGDNPILQMVLGGVARLIEQHGPATPPPLAQAKRAISPALAERFKAMEAAFDRASEAGKFREG